MWSLGVLELVGWRFEAALQATIDAVEINIDHRRDEQRQQLRHAETADHGDAERLTQLRTGAGADRNRQGAEIAANVVAVGYSGGAKRYRRLDG